MPLEPTVEPTRFDRHPDRQDPEVLQRLSGSYTMGPIELAVVLRGDHVLTAAVAGAPPFELQAGRGLRFQVKGLPAVTIEFELDETGAVERLVGQPFGVFLPKP